jgi:hypothetical protein
MLFRAITFEEVQFHKARLMGDNGWRKASE